MAGLGTKFLDIDQLCDALQQSAKNPIVAPFGHIRTWDVSAMNDLSDLMTIAGCTAWFNHDISEWTFADHVNLNHLFRGCQVYNQPFRLRPTLPMTVEVEGLFQDCVALNAPVHLSNVHVSSLAHMLQGCQSFNASVEVQTTNESIASLKNMFYGCATFNQVPIFSGAVRTIDNVDGMFAGCVALNQPMDWSAFSFRSANHMFSHCWSLVGPVSLRVDRLCVVSKDGVYKLHATGLFTDCSALEDVVLTNCGRPVTLPTSSHCHPKRLTLIEPETRPADTYPEELLRAFPLDTFRHEISDGPVHILNWNHSYIQYRVTEHDDIHIELFRTKYGERGGKYLFGAMVYWGASAKKTMSLCVLNGLNNPIAYCLYNRFGFRIMNGDKAVLDPDTADYYVGCPTMRADLRKTSPESVLKVVRGEWYSLPADPPFHVAFCAAENRHQQSQSIERQRSSLPAGNPVASRKNIKIARVQMKVGVSTVRTRKRNREETF